jgi:two-component system KDP operon response regulator KdpE
MIDLTQRLVMLNGDKVKLTPTEYELLKLLATNTGKVICTDYFTSKEVIGYI